MTAPSSDPRAEWSSALRPLGVGPEAADRAFADVRRHYDDPSRHYHTLGHAFDVLRRAAALAERGTLSPALAVAAVLHDVVYDPKANDNEGRSAAYAKDLLATLGVDAALGDEASRLILLTKRHEAEEGDGDGRRLLDADLAILSADATAYDAYAAAIRREYAWVAEADYRAGRRAVLGRFLARPRLYLTETAFREGEARARANLAREVVALGG